jgi:hypothetical protein
MVDIFPFQNQSDIHYRGHLLMRGWGLERFQLKGGYSRGVPMLLLLDV